MVPRKRAIRPIFLSFISSSAGRKLGEPLRTRNPSVLAVQGRLSNKLRKAKPFQAICILEDRPAAGDRRCGEKRRFGAWHGHRVPSRNGTLVAGIPGVRAPATRVAALASGAARGGVDERSQQACGTSRAPRSQIQCTRSPPRPAAIFEYRSTYCRALRVHDQSCRMPVVTNRAHCGGSLM